MIELYNIAYKDWEKYWKDRDTKLKFSLLPKSAEEEKFDNYILN